MQVVVESLKKVSANTTNIALPTGSKGNTGKQGGRGAGGKKGKGAKGGAKAAVAGRPDNRPPCQAAGCTFGWNPGEPGLTDRDIYARLAVRKQFLTATRTCIKP